MTPSDLLPNSRREVGILIIGAALSLGLSSIPGVTIEPQELTDCRTAQAICSADLAGCLESAEDYEARIARCWALSREDDLTITTPEATPWP